MFLEIWKSKDTQKSGFGILLLFGEVNHSIHICRPKQDRKIACQLDLTGDLGMDGGGT